jgi:hypothetical protein
MKPAALLIGVLWMALSAAPSVTEGPDTIRVLWRDPGPIGAKDLYWGAGSPDRAPAPPFTFVKEDTSGTKPKIEVIDAEGAEWTIKLAPASPADNEVHAEIAASRLIWAFGFFVDENYFVREGRIENVKKLSRAADVVGPDGTFRTARFERRVRGGERFGNWDLENNPFNQTKELSALKMLIVLVGNWDARPENAAIIRLPRPDGDVEERYVLSDLGTAFGRWAGGFQKRHSRWNLSDYRESRFLNGVVMNRLEFRYPLMGTERVAVPVDHARWFATLASQLTPTQIRKAFEASGASSAEIEGFSAEVGSRFEAIRTALAGGGQGR